ncbi:hypothetical protein FOIG_16844 [Fusarium odoratissimum NRRL 54006]|uniref:Uncharacterized protein n=1 Tax=Fusarium odoratissimum (strain NRRL 54006) TaxID=1089451 RepID=X0ILW4_FUSO5|nr:uncharacterized protein FOIG_16844 [Fusarium odoratissimum NRRL 54006]EXL89873.1 hypothetical protein FOIG_16844 [Fusarium odoratissimum NRRL 54006]
MLARIRFKSFLDQWQTSIREKLSDEVSCFQRSNDGPTQSMAHRYPDSHTLLLEARPAVATNCKRHGVVATPSGLDCYAKPLSEVVHNPAFHEAQGKPLRLESP